MLQFLNYDSFKKTRRSLLVVAVATLLFAGVTIVEDKISILGLQLQIFAQRIVWTGQIFSAVLLIIYALQAGPEIARLLKEYLLARQKNCKISNLIFSMQIMDLTTTPNMKIAQAAISKNWQIDKKQIKHTLLRS